MDFDLKEAATRNWPIKVTALALATVLWASVPTTEEPTTQLVPVQFQITPPPGYSLRQSLPEVQALYGGAPRELIKVYAAAPRISITIPDTITEPFFTIDLSPLAVILDSDADVLIQDILPRRVVILLEEVVERRVNISPRVTIRPDSGFEVTSEILARPATVIVTGPAGRMESLNTVYTAPIELSNVRQSVNLTVALDTSGIGAVGLSVEDVTVTAQVEWVSDTVFLELPIIIDDESWTTDPAVVQVAVIGPASRLANLPMDSIFVTATPPDSGSVFVSVAITGPDGFTFLAIPDSLRAVRDSSLQ